MASKDLLKAEKVVTFLCSHLFTFRCHNVEHKTVLAVPTPLLRPPMHVHMCARRLTDVNRYNPSLVRERYLGHVTRRMGPGMLDFSSLVFLCDGLR
jgi:hypothetical protein